VHAVLGDSLFALHLLPALAACVNWLLLALLARELGGGRAAQTVAAVAGFSAPVYQAVAGFYSMNAFEPALGTACAWLFARIANGAGTRTWCLLGVALGIGLLNKISMLWLGFGLGLGLLFTPARGWLATPGPWLAAAIALALFAPHLAWQHEHGWPTLEFIRGASQEKMIRKSPLAFERLAARRTLRALPALATVLLLLQGAVSLPLAIPLLPPERVAPYAAAIGIEAPRDQVDDTGELPLHFALRFGWPELAQAVARAAATLAPAERARAVVIARSFGEAGSLHFFAPQLSLPPAVSGHNNYWLWGPGERSGEVALAIETSDAQLAHWYREVAAAASVECRFCNPMLDGAIVYVCRGLREPREQWWSELKRFQ
jgi:hypothetical protein